MDGVPFSVEENIDVVGSATTQGVRALASAIPDADAPHVASLCAAGAIAIARTNLPDFALGLHTDNDCMVLHATRGTPRAHRAAPAEGRRSRLPRV